MMPLTLTRTPGAASIWGVPYHEGIALAPVELDEGTTLECPVSDPRWRYCPVESPTKIWLAPDGRPGVAMTWEEQKGFRPLDLTGRYLLPDGRPACVYGAVPPDLSGVEAIGVGGGGVWSIMYPGRGSWDAEQCAAAKAALEARGVQPHGDVLFDELFAMFPASRSPSRQNTPIDIPDYGAWTKYEVDAAEVEMRRRGLERTLLNLLAILPTLYPHGSRVVGDEDREGEEWKDGPAV